MGVKPVGEVIIPHYSTLILGHVWNPGSGFGCPGTRMFISLRTGSKTVGWRMEGREGAGSVVLFQTAEEVL